MEAVEFFSFPGLNVDAEAPKCAISLASSGSQKAVRDTDNRSLFFSSLGIDPSRVSSASQTHSRIVLVSRDESDLSHFPEGDGVLTRNPSLVPCVTVADCMPVYLYDPVSGFFGVLHSGWKGTGIIGEALSLASVQWGSKPSDVRAILGPHIRSCCYTVDQERADWFRTSFGETVCVLDEQRARDKSPWPWRLSLAEANRLHALERGILLEHLLDAGSCTSCNERYGSSRRQGAGNFVQMAAFAGFF
ncbi:MAG TPA: polyphenol oxidase family protein [Treponemataceae bacterium]|nr:polyphenol oxidase family protein [Treponemataceae bacterium]